VKPALAIAVLLAAAGSARADEGDGALGFRIAFGQLPIGGERPLAVSLAVGSEHELAGKLRGFGEYEWMWLEQDRLTTGSGSRVQLGVRHVLADHVVPKLMRLYVDGELGGGSALLSDPTGVHVVPDGFAGVRFGYDVIPHDARSPANTLQFELSARALYLPHGAGWMAGVGVWWGD